MTGKERILVMGVGNPLMRDEGIGPRAVELLRAGYLFPDHVDVVDAGTMSYMILDLLRGVDRLVIVDAIRETGHPAGTVLVLTPDDIAATQVMHSMHDVRVADILGAAALVDRAPKTVIVGVQIESIEEWVLELSPACAKALPVAVAAVLDQLEELGVVPEPNEDTDVHAQIIEAVRSYKPMPEEALLPHDETAE